MTAFPARGQKAPDFWDAQLKDYIDEADGTKASATALASTNAAVALKADQTDVDTLTTEVGDKADASDVTASLALKADLVAGKVPSTQLPAFVDDVLEFANLAAFPVTGTSGILYLALDTGKLYRWSGSTYAVISDTLVLGSTSTTAMRGDQGTTAYTHSQIITGNPHGTTATDVGAEPTLALPSQVEAEAGTSTTGRKWSSERVRQAIAAALVALLPAYFRSTFIVADYGSGTVPLRNTITTDNLRPVCWKGTTAPTVGGGYALSIDIFMSTA